MSDTPHLKQHREKHAKKTQADVARIVSEISGQNVNQSQISRWEEDPDTIPARMMRSLAQALGITIEELFEPPVGQEDMRVDPGAPYEQVRWNVALLRSYLGTAPSTPPPIGVPSPAQVEDLCVRLQRKPNVVLSGHFDAGKSRLCNALLGEGALPARYRPTTAASTWLRHIEDRPEGYADAVYVFGQGFDPVRIGDPEHCNTHRVASGGLETLSAYAIHKDGKVNTGEYTAVVFLDAPLLRACNLVDLPGHQHNEKDARIAEAGLGHADVLVYLANATGFLDGEDLAHLRGHLRHLPLLEEHGVPPLSNFLLVASHAHPNMTDKDVEDILEGGAQTLIRELSDTVFAERTSRSGKSITYADVRARMFPFWFERADRREPLQRAVRETLGERIPATWRPLADKEVEAFRESSRGACDAQIEQWRRALQDIEAARRDHTARVVAESARSQRRKAGRQKVQTAIQHARQGALVQLSTGYPALVNDDEVERLIRKRYKDKKAAQQHAPGALIDLLQSQVAVDGERRSKELVPLIDEYLGHFGNLGAPARPDGTPSVRIAFDARGTFLGGMAGLGTIGALGAWAATLGNLGGYIIVAKVASLLASLGISVGGSAALVSLVAALGGPMVVGVALAVVVGWVISAFFGESWQRRLAKKVVQALEEKKVRQKFAEGVDKFWRDTETAFTSAAEAVEAEYQRRIDGFGRALASTGSSAEPERLLTQLQAYRDFFAGLPWKRSVPMSYDEQKAAIIVHLHAADRLTRSIEARVGAKDFAPATAAYFAADEVLVHVADRARLRRELDQEGVPLGRYAKQLA